MEKNDDLSYEDLTAYSLLFQVLDENGRKEVMQMATRMSLAAGTTIVRQGEQGEDVYLLREGTVRVTTTGESGEIDLGILSSGVIFGEVAEAGQVPRTATVTAITDVELLCFKGKWLMGLLKLYPQARKVLDSIVARRAEDTIKKMLERG